MGLDSRRPPSSPFGAARSTRRLVAHSVPADPAFCLTSLLLRGVPPHATMFPSPARSLFMWTPYGLLECSVPGATRPLFVLAATTAQRVWTAATSSPLACRVRMAALRLNCGPRRQEWNERIRAKTVRRHMPLWGTQPVSVDGTSFILCARVVPAGQKSSWEYGAGGKAHADSRTTRCQHGSPAGRTDPARPSHSRFSSGDEWEGKDRRKQARGIRTRRSGVEIVEGSSTTNATWWRCPRRVPHAGCLCSEYRRTSSI